VHHHKLARVARELVLEGSLNMTASITLIASAGAQSPNTAAVTTAAIDTTGASLIVVAMASLLGAGPGILTDSKGNSWTTGPSQDGSVCTTSLFFVTSPITGTGHTFTCGTGDGALIVAAYTGTLATSPLDVSSQAHSGGATSLAPGSVTPDQDNSLIIFAAGDQWLGTLTPSVGSIVGTAFPFSAGKAFGMGLANFIQGAAASINPSLSWSGGSAPAEAVGAVFKPAPVVTSSGRFFRGFL
jgi:hypothetical protein